MENNRMAIFAGNANPVFSREVCSRLGVSLGKGINTFFSDGEIRIEINENVRNREVFIIQSTSPPVNDHLVEILLLLDAFKRASARRITAVIPYFGYARQDRKVKPRVPISAKLVADLLQTAGATRIITMDLHAGQIQGFFNIPVDNLFARPNIIKFFKKEFKSFKDIVLVSPDAGGVERTRAFAKKLNAGLAIIDKRRDKPNKAKAMRIIGDVGGKIAIILDDMVDTAGTLTEAAEKIIASGALKVFASCVHPILSGPALERIIKSPLERLWVCDTIPLTKQAEACDKIKVISVVDLIAEAILRSYKGESVTSLFE